MKKIILLFLLLCGGLLNAQISLSEIQDTVGKGYVPITDYDPALATYIQKYMLLQDYLEDSISWASVPVGLHDAVTLAGSYDYITLSGQVITRNQIDLTTDVTGLLPYASLSGAPTLLTQFTDDLGHIEESTTVTDLANGLDISLSTYDITVSPDFVELATETTIDNTDYVIIHDATTPNDGKITWSNLQGAISVTESQVTDLNHYDLATLLTEDGTGSGLDADLLDGQSGAYYLDNTDSQTLSLVTNTLSISGGNSVSLASYLDNTDDQQIDNFSITSDILSLEIESDGQAAQTVDLSPYLDNTDSQTLSFTSPNLSISGGNSVDISAIDTDTQLSEEQVEDYVGGMVTGNTETGITVTYQDIDGTLDFVTSDTSPSNEYNTSVALVGNNLQVTDGGGTLSTSLAVYLDNTDSQGLTWVDGTNTMQISGGTDAVITGFLESEVDGSITNELQDFDVSQLVGTDLQLSLTQDADVYTIDLSSLDDSGTDDQTLQEVLTSGNDAGGLDAINFAEVEADEFIGDLRGAVLFKAQAGETLAKGDVVYVSGISGNTTIVSKADADDATKMPAFGVVAAAASSPNPVDIYTFGTLSNLNTSAYSLGDILYVSTTAGQLTATPPTGESALIQNIAKVTRVDNSAGSIKISGAGRTNATPNLNTGRLFVGNASNQAVADGTMYVDIANSRVGIGTSSPTTRTHIYDATLDLPLLVESGDAAARIAFKDNTTTINPSVGALANNLNWYVENVAEMVLRPTGLDLTTVPTEDTDDILTWGSTGLISKTTKSSIIEDAGYWDRITGNTITPSTATDRLLFTNTADLEILSNAYGGYVQTENAYNLNLGTNDIVAMRIFTDQDIRMFADLYVDADVGIGTTSPQTILHTYSAAPYIRAQSSQAGDLAAGGLQIWDSSSPITQIGLLSSSNNDLDIFHTGTNDIDIWTNSVKRMSIESDGDVIIEQRLSVNDGSPNATLDVIGTLQFETGNQGVGKVLMDTGSGNGYADWEDASTIIEDAGYWDRNSGSGYVVLSNPTDNVGIGTNGTYIEPNHKLEIATVGSGDDVKMSLSNASGGNERLHLGYGTLQNNVMPAQILVSQYGDLSLSSRTNYPSDIIFYTNSATTATERMRIIDSGNVGIGTNSPTELLHVNGYARFGNRVAIGNATTSAADLYIYSTSNTNIRMADGNEYIDMFYNSNATSTSVFLMDLDPTNASGTAVTEMRIDIDNAREVTITPTGMGLNGITAPSATLDVNGDVEIATVNTDNTTDDVLVHSSDGTVSKRTIDNLIEDAGYWDRSAGILTPSNANDVLKIETAGGVDGFASQLLINGNTSGGSPALASKIELRSNSDFRGRGIKYTNTTDAETWFSGVPYTGAGYSIGFDATTNQSEYDANSLLYIQEGGNVGIGLTNPSQKLHVDNGNLLVTQSTTNTRGIKISSNGEIDQNNNSDWLHLQRYQDGLLAIGNNSSANVYVANNLGIGTSSPTELLDIQGSGTQPTLNIRDNSDVNTRFRMRGNSANDLIDYRLEINTVGDSYTWHDRGANTTIHYDDVNTYIWRSNASVERMRLNATGLGIGTSSPIGNLTVAAENRVITIGDSGRTNYAMMKATNTAGTSAAYMIQDAYGILYEQSGTLAYYHKPLHGGIGLYDVTGATEDVRISATTDSWFNGGNLGIGTNSPSVELEIGDGTSGHSIIVNTTDGYQRFFGYGIESNRAANYWRPITSRNNLDDLYIGTTTQQWDEIFFSFEVEAEFFQSGNIAFEINTGNVNIWDRYLSLYDTGSNEDIRLNPNGDSYIMNDLGIGTSSPSKQLTIQSTGNAESLIETTIDTLAATTLKNADAQWRIGVEPFDDGLIFRQQDAGYTVGEALKLETDLDVRVYNNLTVDGIANVTGNITGYADITGDDFFVRQGIVAEGDTDTEIDMNLNDEIEFYAGGRKMFRIDEDAQDVIEFNPNAHDIDFLIDSDNVSEIFKVDASADEVQINGEVTWSERALGEMYRLAEQSVTNGNTDKIDFATQVYQDGDITTDVTTNDRITVTNAGKYTIHLSALMSNDGTSSDSGRLLIYKNGTQIADSEFSNVQHVGLDSVTKSISGILNLAASDYLEVYLQELSGTGDAEVARVRFTVKREIGY